MIKQVQIRNYKSIAAAIVDLQRLTVLVGPNGAGKSNFVDALAFVADCLNYSVELAFRNRGGIAAVRRRSGGYPTHIGFRFILDLPEGGWADYAFEIAAKPREAFRVAHERCRIRRMRQAEQSFEVRDGQFIKEVTGIRPRVEPDRLALTVTSAVEEFRPVYDMLTRIRRYLVSPEQIRALQDPDPEEGKWLRPDGSNAAAVLKRLSEVTDRNGHTYERLCSLLAKVVPGTKQVIHRSLGQKETLQFKQDVGLRDPWTFDALNMSDGTLRVLGVLLAVYQPSTPSLIAIEEPEATIHPAAAEVLMDILQDGATRSQVLLTTHSPDVLDNKQLTDDQILVIESEQGKTYVSPLNGVSREVIRQRLYTPGELLRANELHPDLEQARRNEQQLDLFGVEFLLNSEPKTAIIPANSDVRCGCGRNRRTDNSRTA